MVSWISCDILFSYLPKICIQHLYLHRMAESLHMYACMKNPCSQVVSAPDFESWGHVFESRWRQNSVRDCHRVIILIIHYLNNRLNMTLMGWLGHKTSTQSNDLNSVEKDAIQQIITIIYAFLSSRLLTQCSQYFDLRCKLLEGLSGNLKYNS